MGYIFSDNGRDWEGYHPPEEINLPSLARIMVGQMMILIIQFLKERLVHRNLDASFKPQQPRLSTVQLLPGGNHTVYATVFGSWNAIVPVGHEIVRIDFTENASEPQGWSSETSVFASDLSGPLPIVFHPSGDFLFYTNFLDDGTLYVISSS